MNNREKREHNIHINLEKQIDKIAKHNRQGSYQTKLKYQADMIGFAKFLAKDFGVQNIRNISDKHVQNYVKHMQERDLSPSTIKDRLSAIRFFHSKIDRPKHTISDNSKFQLEKRSFGGVNRAWNDGEYKAFRSLCESRGNDRMVSIAMLACNEGLRIHETLKIERSQAEKALRNDSLTVKGKGGKIREVPLSAESRNMLEERLEETDRGQKLFVQQNEKTHLVIKQCQNFINRNREHFQSEREQGEANITFHGLRHTYAQDRYEELIEEGRSDYEARVEVSQLLGHERDDVTRIYLAR